MNWWTKFWILGAFDVASIAWLFWRVRRDDRADATRRREYRQVVVGMLTTGVEATRIGTFLGSPLPVLTLAEDDEMDDARWAGITARQFALMLRMRDHEQWATAG